MQDICCSGASVMSEDATSGGGMSALASAAVGAGAAAAMVAQKPISIPKKTPEQLMKRYQEHVDGNALVIFPLSFLLFNVCYWGHFLSKIDWL